MSGVRDRSGRTATARAARRWAPRAAAALAAALASALLGGGGAAAIEWEATLADYLPEGGDYDPAVPTPASVLGFEIGERHVRPGELLRYLEALAAASDRVTVEIQGRTHEGRPQPLAIVTSPAYHARLEEVRQAHLALSDPAVPDPAPERLDELPVVVWLGYSIHGNEASGANAAPLVAYHLAAGRSPEVTALLEQAVVLIDPSLNPDGLGRFAGWVNAHRGRRPVEDPEDREHNEPWPGGRGNHYWFDLNRDWLLVQHPESRHRIATLRRWRPNLLGDYHEMGSDATYFFQPGVPSRQNPLTPPENLELTRRVAEFHARTLDRAGRRYYTEETFDDFYPGKGSTYPDLTGAVGVLFEQASARGHRRETARGPLSLPVTLHNQFLTSLSMLEAAAELRRELLDYQRRFVVTALEAAEGDPVRAYAVGAADDPARAFHLLEVLAAHGIEVHRLARPVEAEGRRFSPGSAWAVPVAQPQYRLVKALFEAPTEFAESTFYDVSAWTLPLAFGLPSAALRGRAWEPGLLGEREGSPGLPPGRLPEAPSPYAYAFEWNGAHAARALQRLFAGDFRAEVATVPIEAVTDAGRRRFAAGSVVVPAATDDEAAARLDEALRSIAEEDGVDVYAVASGLTPSGVDLGSPKLRPVEPPAPALVVGSGVSSIEAGEVWHLLDQRVGLPVTLLDHERLARADLGRYTHLLLVDGDYSRLAEPAVTAIRGWVERGGVVVASRRAAEWAHQALLAEPQDPAVGGGAAPGTPAAGATAAAGVVPPAPPSQVPPLRERTAYADYESARAAETISGAIFRLELDATHPLGFGLGGAELPVFRSSTALLTASANPFENVARYADRPLLAGYASERRLNEVAGTAAVVAGRLGEGAVIRFADDLNFRAVWYGTQKLYLNAIYLGGLIERTEAPDEWD